MFSLTSAEEPRPGSKHASLPPIQARAEALPAPAIASKLANSVRPVKTNRPFTPRKIGKKLYGVSNHWLPPVHGDRLHSSRGRSANGATKLPTICENTSVRKQFRAVSVEEDDYRTGSSGYSSLTFSSTGDVQLILEDLSRSKTSEQRCECLRRLRRAIQQPEMLAASTKKEVLDALTPLLMDEEQEILVCLLDLLLTLRVSLTLIAKLLFRMASEDDSEDELASLSADILEEFLSRLGEASPVTDGESLLFGYGALKLLSFSSKTLLRLCSSGFVDLIVLHGKIVSQEESTSKTYAGLMFQITGCIRNILDCPRGREAFENLHGERLVHSTIDSFRHDAEVMCNVSRILSVLSLSHDNGTSRCIADPLLPRKAFSLLEAFPKRRDLVVRLAFYLGSVAASQEDARMPIATLSLNNNFLPELLKRYLSTMTKASDKKSSSLDSCEDTEDLGASASHADTAVKIIRVFANVSIDSEAGRQMALNEILVRSLLTILEEFEASEEYSVSWKDLLVPTLATLNNLSFYPMLLHSAVYQRVRPSACEIARCSLSSMASLEALRVLGNLSRRHDIRLLMKEEDLMTQLMVWMKSSSLWEETDADVKAEARFSAVGVIVNLLTDEDLRRRFEQLGGLSLCRRLLVEAQETRDYALAAIACQAAWNFLVSGSRHVGDEELADLEEALVMLLDVDDDEKDFYGEGGDGGEDLDEDYRKFCSVGYQLLSRIMP